jgi:retron-type reverse transcriptase
MRFPYQWAIEGDIKGCFDNIDHHGLMQRVRRRVGDAKVNRLVVAFLKAGVMSEEQFFRNSAGTPQGGILSPLLANIALSVIDERYERYAWPRRSPSLLHDKRKVQLRAGNNRNGDKRAGNVVPRKAPRLAQPDVARVERLLPSRMGSEARLR